jgi:hypothetical protein
MKLKSTYVAAFFVVFAMLFATKAQSQTTLTDSVKLFSNQFKALDGGSREQIFVKYLSTSIRVKHPYETVTLSSSLMGANFSTKQDIRMLLGNPNVHYPDAIDEFYLSPTPTTNKLVIVYDVNDIVVSFSIKN